MENLVNSELVMPKLAPLVYNNSFVNSMSRNIMLIDSNVTESQLFYDSANPNTFPIKYSYTSQKTELLELLRNKFLSGIDRISFVFHDSSVLEKEFLDNSCFFVKDDLLDGQTTFSENVLFLTSLVNEFHITHFDFLACNTLQYDNWKQYYELLTRQSGVVCGASNDATGNLVSGADWIMENTQEDIKNIYFTNNIENYASTLVATTISQNGGTIYIKNGANNTIEYSTNNQTSWINIGSNYPINIQNTGGSLSNILTVEFTTNLIINNVGAYFVCGSSYITFDGMEKTITFSSITNYPGLIQNGTSGTNGFHTITVQNIKTASQSSTLKSEGAWLCQSYFGRNINNISGFNLLTNLIQILNCSNSASLDNSYCGGICGFGAGDKGVVSVTNCSNSGTMIGSGASGICGKLAGQNGGNVTITNCSNSGAIGVGGGGICGQEAAKNAGRVTITNCSNSGEIKGQLSGGICGSNVRNITITGCSNSGTISSIESGGICGSGAGQGLAVIPIKNCSNSGEIKGNYSGGICGSYAGQFDATINITDCYNTGNITASFSGGIAGRGFGYWTTKTCSIENCYSTGTISGISSGGICGAQVGLPAVTNMNPVVNITNCYTLGSIATTCGGILGGNESSYTYIPIPTITLSNCYTSGAVTDTGSGLIANGLPIKNNVTVNNCYIANNAWSDTTANASLTGEPVSNPGVGATWSSLAINTPYLLSVYNSALYSPNNATVVSASYTTNPGLQTGSTYSIINNIPSTANSIVQDTGIISYTNMGVATTTTNVVAYNSASSANYYYGYNINSFTITYTALVPTLSNFSILPKTYGTAPFQINPPTSNSSGAFSYTSSDTSVATIVENIITIVSAGSSIITATQAPNGDYASGTITTSFQVNKANPIITYESTLFQIVPPTSTSQGAFSYTSSDTSVATISGTTITIIGIGSSIITTIQEETENYSSGISTMLFYVKQNSESNPLQLTVSVNGNVLVNGSSSFLTMSFG